MDVQSPEFDQFQAIILDKSKEHPKWQKIHIELLAIKIQMEDYLKSNDKGEPKLLGDFLRSFLDTLNIRQNKLARYIDIEPSNLNKHVPRTRNLFILPMILDNFFQ